VRRLEARLVRVLGTYPVAPLDLVGPRNLLAREPASRRLAADELGTQPGGRRPPTERSRLVRELPRLDECLGVDAIPQRGRSEVRVDEPVDAASEPEAEQEVPLPHVVHGREIILAERCAS